MKERGEKAGRDERGIKPSGLGNIKPLYRRENIIFHRNFMGFCCYNAFLLFFLFMNSFLFFKLIRKIGGYKIIYGLEYYYFLYHKIIQFSSIHTNSVS